MPPSPSTEPVVGPGADAGLPVRLLLVGAGADAAPWRAALETVGVAARTRTVEGAGGVAGALRDPLDLILVWDDAAGRRALEVLAAVRREGFEAPVAVVVHPEGEASGSWGPAAAVLPRDRPSWLSAALDRVLRHARLEARTALIGRIAHDLNNLLAPIPLAVQLLRGQRGPVEPGQLEAVDAASRGSMVAMKELSALLVAREDAPLQVRAKHLLAICARHWRDALEGESGAPAAVLTDFPPDLASVRADVARLLQILSCLMRRALDGAAGGELLLQGRNVEPDGTASPAVELRVACAATGVEALAGAGGMVAEATGEAAGDLEALREVVAAHGGELGRLPTGPAARGFALLLPAAGAGRRLPGSVPRGRPSTPGRGSVPSRPPEEPPRGAAAGGPPRQGVGRSVLVIENDEECRRTTRETLEGYGLAVVTAADGTEGVAVYAERPGAIATVLVDYSLPHMDGPATIKALRRIDPTVPTILTTSAEWEARRIEHDPDGPATVLRKPYDAESLLAAIREALEEE